MPINDNSNIDISKLKNSIDKVASSMNKNSIKTPNFQITTPDIVENTRVMMNELQNSANEALIKKEKYENEVLETLKKIEGNTANLKTIVDLIQSSNETQSEVLVIINELLALAKEKDIEVVDSKYRIIMNKITTFTNDVNTITALSNFGITIFNILKSKA